jgi:pimeloyl-ACP methyl ester carboxylesterase
MTIARHVANDAAHPLMRALQERGGAEPAREGAVTVVLDDCAVRRLLAAPQGGHELPPGLRRLHADVTRVRVVVDYRTFSAFCSIASLAQHLRGAVEAAAGRRIALQVFVLGNALDDPGEAAFERLVAAVAGLVFEANRRDEAHFGRVALTLPDEADGEIHLLPVDAVADFLARRPDALPTGATLLYGLPLCSRRELVRAIAAAAGVPVRDATGALPMDAVGELVRVELQHACDREMLDREAELVARSDSDVSLQSPALLAATDWRARVKAVVEPLRAAHEALQAPRYEALPALERRVAADGQVRYTRCGDGESAVLLVNAFGLPMDVWHELARRLSATVRVLALDAGDAGDPYYAAPDAPARFVRAAQAVLAAEGLEACHVASWCGGSKLALELAHRRPGAVSSLALLAPSFAGERDGAEGEGDSSFETSLATMCQVVDRLPASAPGMARSMQVMLSRRVVAAPDAEDDAAGTSVFALHDRVTTPWVHAPFESATRMVDYSRRLLAFRAHRAVPGIDELEERLPMPLMLVTGELDATTNNRRARALLSGCGALAHFELQRAGHYFPHQNAALVAPLLLDFLHHGTKTESPHPRLRRIAEAPEELLVSGEL